MRKLLWLLCMAPALALGQSQSNTAGGVSANCPTCNLIDSTLTLSGALTSSATGSFVVTSQTTDGASAIGFKLNTSTSYVTSGGKLLSLLNNTTEKFAFAYDGSLTTQGSITASGSNIQAGSQFVGDKLSAKSNGPVSIYGLANDGSTAVGVILGPSTALSTTGAKIAQFCNANSFGTCSTEKASIDKDGNFLSASHPSCAMSAATTCTATVPSGSVCLCQATSGTVAAVACAVSSTTATCTAASSNSNTWNIFTR